MPIPKMKLSAVIREDPFTIIIVHFMKITLALGVIPDLISTLIIQSLQIIFMRL